MNDEQLLNEYNNIPDNFQEENEDFNELYVVALLAILTALLMLVSLPLNVTRTGLLLLERTVNTKVDQIIYGLEEKAKKLVTEKVTAAYVEGVVNTRMILQRQPFDKKVKQQITETVTSNLGKEHQAALDMIINQTYDDLLKATRNTSLGVKQLVRQTVAREMTDAAMNGRVNASEVSKRIEEQLRKQLIEKGFENADVAIIDKAKRKWKLRTYSNMVVRTKMSIAYIEAIRNECKESGKDLALITTNANTKDECKNYEGMIISLNGLTEGYAAYEAIRKSKECFHPNCRHSVIPVLDVALLPANVRQKHERQMYKYRTK